MKNERVGIVCGFFLILVALAVAQVATTPEEPYTKPQAISYNETPTGAQIDWQSIRTWCRDKDVGFDVSLVIYKGTTQIRFVSGGNLVDSVRVVVTETELNDVLKTMGEKPDFTDALTKAAVAKLPK
jgi:hypothetical protein